MNIIVVGCGRMGSELAYRLYKMGHHVAIMDVSAAAFNNLPADFQGRKVEGEILARDVLHRAGIETADGLAAVTNSDAYNAVVGHLAHSVYHVRNVVVRNYDPRWRAMHDAFGFQVISSSTWGAQRMAEMISDASFPTVFSAGNGEVEVYELTVPETWSGRTVGDLVAGDPCVAVAVTRAGRAELPTAGTVLAGGDVIHISATLPGIQALRGRLAGEREV
jgi:trk system potassium uptake protein TrkA